MAIIGHYQELHAKLKTFETQKTQLEDKIKATPRVMQGALNLGFFQLNRKKDEVQSKIKKINSIIQPDIIA